MDTVLLVGSESTELSAIKGALSQAGYEVITASLGFDGFEAIARFQPCAVIFLPPEGALGKAYLGQFRFADYPGPLFVAASDAALGPAPNHMAGPVAFLGDARPESALAAMEQRDRLQAA